MSPDTPLQTPVRERAQLLPAGSALGPVHIAVSDRDRALGFWTGVLGLVVLRDDDSQVALGAGERELVVLHPGAAGPVESGHTGLYHLAIHMPSRHELARTLARLFALRYPNSPTDHLATETTYLSDPDRNGIELTWETPERGEIGQGPDGRLIARAADGSLHSGVEALDVRSLLSELSPDDPLDPPLAAGARIGHVHLHVRDLDETMRFYRDVIGLQEQGIARSFRMGETRLDHAVPHTIAFNTWAGAGATPAPAHTAGLRHFTLQLPHAAALDQLRARLRAAQARFEEIGEGIALSDPSRNPLHVLAPSAER